MAEPDEEHRGRAGEATRRALDLDGRAWLPVIPRLASGTHAVAYDRAGLGASDPDPELPTIDRRLADLAS